MNNTRRSLALLLFAAACPVLAEPNAASLPIQAAPLMANNTAYNLLALAPQVSASPVIDGIIDPLWETVPSYMVGYVMTDENKLGYGYPGILPGHQTLWKAVWNSEGITVLVRYKVQLDDDAHYLRLGISSAYTKLWGNSIGLGDVLIDFDLGGLNSRPRMPQSLLGATPPEGSITEAWDHLNGYPYLVGEIHIKWEGLLQDPSVSWSPLTATFSPHLEQGNNDARNYIGFQIWQGARSSSTSYITNESSWSISQDWDWVEPGGDLDTLEWGTLFLGLGEEQHYHSLFQPFTSARFEGGWAYNALGFLYDAAYPFVWSDKDSTWWYVYPGGWSTEESGFFYYNFSTEKWAWTWRGGYGEPYIF